MNAKVDINVEILNGEDAGYSFSDRRVVPLFDPPMDGYVHPYTLEYKFMTPGLHMKLQQYMLKSKEDVGFPILALLDKKSDVEFMLKQMKESAEAVQNVNGAASTLLNGIECNEEFLDRIDAMLELLKLIQGE